MISFLSFVIKPTSAKRAVLLCVAVKLEVWIYPQMIPDHRNSWRMTNRSDNSTFLLPRVNAAEQVDGAIVDLNPQSLGELARVGRYDEMTDLHLADCMLCGSCSYVCPSNIPLAQLFFLSKSALKRKPPVVEAIRTVAAGAV